MSTSGPRPTTLGRGRRCGGSWPSSPSGGSDHTAIVVVDADTLVDRHPLRVFDAHLGAGHRAVQGYYGVRGVESGGANVALRAAALSLRHYVRPLGRTALGASCGLYGNGMAFEAELFGSRTWSNHLTEDIEFQMELLLDGIPVAFAADAVIEAEMPATLAESQSQNERWERGRIELARRYVPRLVSVVHSVERPEQVRARRRRHRPPCPTAVGAPRRDQRFHDVDRGRRHRAPVARLPPRPPPRLLPPAVIAGHVLSGLVMVGAPPTVYRSLLGAAPRVVESAALARNARPHATKCVGPARRATRTRTPRSG